MCGHIIFSSYRCFVTFVGNSIADHMVKVYSSIGIVIALEVASRVACVYDAWSIRRLNVFVVCKFSVENENQHYRI